MCIGVADATWLDGVNDAADTTTQTAWARLESLDMTRILLLSRCLVEGFPLGASKEVTQTAEVWTT